MTYLEQLDEQLQKCIEKMDKRGHVQFMSTPILDDLVHDGFLEPAQGWGNNSGYKVVATKAKRFIGYVESERLKIIDIEKENRIKELTAQNLILSNKNLDLSNKALKDRWFFAIIGFLVSAILNVLIHLSFP